MRADCHASPTSARRNRLNFGQLWEDARLSAPTRDETSDKLAANTNGTSLEDNQSGGPPAPAPPPPPQQPTVTKGILVGRRVIIDGLSSRPELNGKVAKAVSYNADKGRYGVRVEGAGGALLSLRPENVNTVLEQ